MATAFNAELACASRVSLRRSFSENISRKNVCPMPVLSNRGKVTMSAKSNESENRDLRKFCMDPFHEGNALKIISGLHNFDRSSVSAVVMAAEQGGATHVDIACDPDLVKLALSLTNLPICVSSINPEAFVPCVEAGAHMVEIGNFDGFYKSGRVFSAAEVLDLTIKTRQLLPTVVLSVTVPHTLPLVEQVHLAEELERHGADIIQTEGGTSAYPLASGVQGLIQKATPALSATYAIAKSVNVPVMCSSGMTDVTAPMAKSVGAAGVGVGTAVNKLQEGIAMTAGVRLIAEAMGTKAPSRNLSMK